MVEERAKMWIMLADLTGLGNEDWWLMNSEEIFCILAKMLLICFLFCLQIREGKQELT